MKERAISALTAIPPDCRGETWLRAGMAAKAAGVTFDEFNSWSARGGQSYKGERDTRTRWESFRSDGGITPATLFHLARDFGWNEPPIRKGGKPLRDPQAIWDAGEPATPQHPYIVRKVGQPLGLRVYRGSLRIADASVDGWLMIPARRNGRIQSLQFIPPAEGKKLNLPGATLAGAFHVLGQLQADAPAFVVEGIGAAWTIHEATGGAVVVTFGSGNTSRIAEAIAERASRLVLVADRGKERARKADAERLGCAWVEMPPDLADGDDVNDLHVRDGIGAVRVALQMERSAGSDKARQFKFARVSDLLSAGLKPIDWLVRGYVEADSLALLFGDPGCGKSFAAIDLACCIATGRPWHGNKTAPGPVFYIAGEGQNGLMRRFCAWAIHNDASLEKAPLFVSHKPARLYDADTASEVSEEVGRLALEHGQMPSLIVIDTLARNFGGADENSAQDMGAFVANLDEYLKAKFRACVLIVHHSGHADKSRARGSTALKGALDAEYSVAKDDDGTIRIEATKMKDAEQPEAIAFRMESVPLPLIDEDGSQVTGVALSTVSYLPGPKTGKSGRGRNQTMALRALALLLEEQRARLSVSGNNPNGARVTVDDWRQRMKDCGLNKYAIRDLMASLKEAGKIVTEFGGYVRVVEEHF